MKRSVEIAGALRAEILRDVLAGRLAPGDPLPSEKELMATFGVARPTIREAVRLLEASGFVEVRLGVRGGAYVTLPGVELAALHVSVLLRLQGTTIGDVRRMRQLLECAAVRLVADAPTADAIDGLRAVVVDAAAVVGDTEAFVGCSLRFLEELVAHAGNGTLRLLATLLGEITEAATSSAARSYQRPSTMSLERWNGLGARAMARVVDLIAAGDADGAETFWRRHTEALLDGGAVGDRDPVTWPELDERAAVTDGGTSRARR